MNLLLVGEKVNTIGLFSLNKVKLSMIYVLKRFLFTKKWKMLRIHLDMPWIYYPISKSSWYKINNLFNVIWSHMWENCHNGQTALRRPISCLYTGWFNVEMRGNASKCHFIFNTFKFDTFTDTQTVDHIKFYILSKRQINCMCSFNMFSTYCN